MSYFHNIFRHILVLCVLPALFSCASANLTSLPMIPPQSGMHPQTTMDLYVDSMTFQGVVSGNATSRAEPIMIRYIYNKNFFNNVLSSDNNNREGNPDALRMKVVVRPKENHTFDWRFTWPAVYPMPFYWPVQYKKGTVAVELQCEVFDNNGSLITQLDTSHSEDYLTKIYGFFRTADAESKLVTCYESVFATLADKITSDNKVTSLGGSSSTTKPSTFTAKKRPETTTAKSSPKPVVPMEESGIPDNIDFGNYYALIIGINDYKHLTKLQTAVNDAQAIADVLQKNYRFNVKLLINPNRTEIISSLSHLRRTMTSNDNLLIYYAGHGWLDKQAQEGYWLPVDATQDNEANWLSNATITSNIRALSAKHIMVIADSCYSGNLTRGLHIKHKTSDYLSRMAKKKTRVVLASGGLEPVEDSGGENNHSVFAAALISTLQENRSVMDGTDLFSKIKRPVMVNTDQVPEYGDIRKTGHDGGDFLFVFAQK
ncbi:MAG: caspase family protein [Proteobacteria bacterium]|nr:caspase family protein [Pseudomonadota bacterium]